MLNKEFTKEILKSIDITRQTALNHLELTLENYTEIMSRLDIMTYLLLQEDKNSFKVE